MTFYIRCALTLTAVVALVFVLEKYSRTRGLNPETNIQIVDLGERGGVMIVIEPKERPINKEEIEKALQPLSEKKEVK